MRRGYARWSAPALVALFTIIIFLPALKNGFVAWDDNRNFLNNPGYRGLGLTQLHWMWTTFHLGHYVPLSWMTLGLDYVVWGMHPAGYHFTNVVLHAANAVLLFHLARRLLMQRVAPSADSRSLDTAAAFAALVFAIHPLRVESVAWITERRDMLSLLFALATILAYLCACEREEHRRRWYWLAVGFFACALLSKATAMTVPAVLLILNVYPLARIAPSRAFTEEARRVYLELVPFGLLSVGIMMLSMVALDPPAQLPLTGKAAVSAYSLAFYLWKTILPLGLSPLYQMPQRIEPGAAVFVGSYAVAIALLAVTWVFHRRWPGLSTALAAFIVVSLPMLGIVQNGPQIAADRYTYHAAPALAVLAGAAFWHLEQFKPTLSRALGGGILLVLGALTWNQITVWRDSQSLWSRVLAVDPRSSIALSAYVSLLVAQDRVEEALSLSERAVAIAPNDAKAHDALGVALARRGRIDEAIAQYERALALDAELDEAHNNWGIASVQQGDLAAAVGHYRLALASNPDNADTHVNWGNALVRMERPDDAIPHYREALRIRIDHAGAHHNWGVALARQGKLAEAIEHFRQALAIDPSHADAKQYLDQATRLLGGR